MGIETGFRLRHERRQDERHELNESKSAKRIGRRLVRQIVDAEDDLMIVRGGPLGLVPTHPTFKAYIQVANNLAADGHAVEFEVHEHIVGNLRSASMHDVIVVTSLEGMAIPEPDDPAVQGKIVFRTSGILKEQQ